MLLNLRTKKAPKAFFSFSRDIYLLTQKLLVYFITLLLLMLLRDSVTSRVREISNFKWLPTKLDCLVPLKYYSTYQKTPLKRITHFLKSRSLKITTPSGGAYPYRLSRGVPPSFFQGHKNNIYVSVILLRTYNIQIL